MRGGEGDFSMTSPTYIMLNKVEVPIPVDVVINRIIEGYGIVFLLDYLYERYDAAEIQEWFEGSKPSEGN